jgi:hypothetical protein
MYQDLNYFIVQSRMNFTFTPDFIENIKEVKFHPHLKFNQLSLYLSDEYRNELDIFLDREEHPDVIQERYNFVNKHFKIVFEGGEANYRRNGDKWELIESYLTWIE